MSESFDRMGMLMGEDAMQKLAGAHICVVGLGGVGGQVVEILARSGVGALSVVDYDRISITNINRQILATHATVGKFKAEAAKERILSINPECKVVAHNVFINEESVGGLDFASYDYVVDAMDRIAGKTTLVKAAQAAGTPIISCMGTGNKVDPTAFEIAELFETKVCPLCRVMRKVCRRKGIDHLEVLYSREVPLDTTQERTQSSCAFVPAAAGILLAAHVIKTLTGIWGEGLNLS